MKGKFASAGVRYICFLLLFLLLFTYVQQVLRYKGERVEFLQARYESYFADVDKGMDVDVLYVGSSPIYAAVSPMIMWDEYGYTGMNLAASTQNAISLYYGVLYALEASAPKVLVLDFCDIERVKLASNAYEYYAFRRMSDVIKSPWLKLQYTIDVMRTSQRWDYFLPMIQFHDRWTELSATDFTSNVDEYVEYTKGGLFHMNVEEVALDGEYDLSVPSKNLCELPVSYYKKLIALCRERGIQVVCVSPPKANLGDNMASYNAVAQFCLENDIPYLNYNSPELSAEMQLDYKTDFYNAGHLNARGSFKLSRSLAKQLETLFDLPDHRTDPVYTSWNEELAQFKEGYKITLASSLGQEKSS